MSANMTVETTKTKKQVTKTQRYKLKKDIMFDIMLNSEKWNNIFPRINVKFLGDKVETGAKYTSHLEGDPEETFELTLVDKAKGIITGKQIKSSELFKEMNYMISYIEEDSDTTSLTVTINYIPATTLFGLADKMPASKLEKLVEDVVESSVTNITKEFSNPNYLEIEKRIKISKYLIKKHYMTLMKATLGN